MGLILNYCKDCEHCRRCEVWGEFKCTKKEKYLYSSNPIACEDFKKRKGEIEKCKCDDCHSRGEVED